MINTNFNSISYSLHWYLKNIMPLPMSYFCFKIGYLINLKIKTIKQMYCIYTSLLFDLF